MSSVNNSPAETARQKVLGFDNCFFVDVGPGCTGLAIFWNNNITVDLLSYSALHIDVVITYDSSISFRFTGMHGRSESVLKKHNWALIDRLRDASPLPWLLGGDFNEILTFSEKQGGNRKPHHQLTDFRECLLRNDLADCKPSRGWFTWMKSGSRTMPIRERLDRFIADNAWFLTFPTFRAWSDYSPNSDHHFILLDTVAPPHAPEARGKDSIFRFDDCWAREPDCISMVQSLWAHSTGSFSGRLATICEGLRHWQSTKRATEWERIPQLKSEINRLSSRRLSPQGLEVLLAAKGELSHLLKFQEAYWAQRSRVLWLSAGDQNTSFFHAKASARKKKNAIMGLYDCNGYWKTSTTEVLRVASDYFVSHFSANPLIDAPAFLEHITPSITADMNSGLLAPFTTEEDFVSLCLDLLRGHTDMASVNETVIVLIPKVDKPTSMRQLRPISLCTVIYKMVSKVLVNRMKAILPHCISSAQAAFVQGRSITDNILVAHELVHTLHTLVSRSSQGAVFKLDMEKAFDWVEWPFLKAVMLCLGFAPSWVDLIMSCISSVSSRVRVRGALSEAIRLSAALTAAQHEGHLPGVRASKHGHPVNHLLFADDSLVFLRNNLTEVQCLKDILLTYSSVSGQKVNFSKSTAYFSPRTPPAHRTTVHEALGVQEVDDPGIYLGVPLLIGKNKYAAFGRYRDKVDTRVSKWSNLLLSFSGREVLTKSVAQALPQYVTSCYLLPCSLVEEMSRSIRRFWWSGKGSARGWPLVAWDDICLPKALRLAPARSSFAWKGLHRAMLRLRDGFFWTLGIDSQVRLFRDRWGGFSPIALDGDTIDREEIPLRCRDFMVPRQACWDRAKLLAHLPPGDMDCILEVPISSDRADTLIWGDHDSGLYTVRSGYLFLRQPPAPLGPPLRLWKIMAKLPTIPKVRSFGWRCGRDALPVGSRLRDAGLSDGACPVCGVGFEDVLHVLRDCPYSSMALRQAGFNGSSFPPIMLR
ncbi:hypothetical protein GQ457_08G031650 [Hibiscus cannabinus]